MTQAWLPDTPACGGLDYFRQWLYGLHPRPDSYGAINASDEASFIEGTRFPQPLNASSQLCHADTSLLVENSIVQLHAYS